MDLHKPQIARKHTYKVNDATGSVSQHLCDPSSSSDPSSLSDPSSNRFLITPKSDVSPSSAIEIISQNTNENSSTLDVSFF